MADDRTCIKCGRGTSQVRSWTVGLVPVGQHLCGECAGHYAQQGEAAPTEGETDG